MTHGGALPVLPQGPAAVADLREEVLLGPVGEVQDAQVLSDEPRSVHGVVAVGQVRPAVGPEGDLGQRVGPCSHQEALGRAHRVVDVRGLHGSVRGRTLQDLGQGAAQPVPELVGVEGNDPLGTAGHSCLRQQVHLVLLQEPGLGVVHHDQPQRALVDLQELPGAVR